MVPQLASKHIKVVLGGQGGDEIFGGYARYILAYFEQCMKAAINGTYKNGDYVVTLESIIPNLGLLREYEPMMKSFWNEGLFGPMDERYFRLIDRSKDMQDEATIAWNFFTALYYKASGTPWALIIGRDLLKLNFKSFIRKEKKYENTNELVKQLELDRQLCISN